MQRIKESLRQVILTILQNAKIQDLDAKKVGLLSKAMLAIEQFPRLITWDNTLRIYVKNQIGKDNLWRRVAFEEDHVTLSNEESLHGPYGHDSRWTLIFEHFPDTESDVTEEDQNAIAEWCQLTCTEISSSFCNVELDYYDDLGWDVFDSIEESEDDDLDEFEVDAVDTDGANPDTYEVAIGTQPVQYNYAIVEQVLWKKYSSYMLGTTIQINGAHFTVDLVVNAALTDLNNNPNLIPEDIVDKWVAYFQT